METTKLVVAVKLLVVVIVVVAISTVLVILVILAQEFCFIAAGDVAAGEFHLCWKICKIKNRGFELAIILTHWLFLKKIDANCLLLFGNWMY